MEEGMTNNNNNESGGGGTTQSDEVVIGKPPVRPKTSTTNAVLREITRDHQQINSKSLVVTSNRDNLTDKSVSTNKSKSSRKKQGKDEWDRYFAFIKDKDRMKLMQMPDVPPKQQQSRRVSKSATTVKRSRSMNNVGESKESGIEEEQQQPRVQTRAVTSKRSNEAPATTTKSKKSLSFEDEQQHNQRSNKRNNDELKSMHETKSKPEVYDKLHNNHKSVSILRKSAESADESNGDNDAAHFNTAYKNLVRSLRANLNYYNNIKSYQRQMFRENRFYTD